jgi:hypothetical protein
LEAAGISREGIIVFVGNKASVSVVQNMGLRAIFSPGLGGMPSNAAENYGDPSFGSMMWLKVTAVYVALAAGFEVLFQDTVNDDDNLSLHHNLRHHLIRLIFSF